MMTMDENENVEYNSPFAPDENDIVDIPADWAFPKIFQPTIKLRDGTVINGYAQRSPLGNGVYIYPDGVDHTYAELSSIFSDPEKTQIIQSRTSDSEMTIYSGYIQIGSITSDATGKFTILLRKPY